MSLALTERFLLLFSDYREALQRAQRAEQSESMARIEMGELQKRLDDVQAKALDRERDLTDRMMRVRFGNQITLSPEEIAAGLTQQKLTQKPATQSVKEWHKKKIEEATRNLQMMVSKVN